MKQAKTSLNIHLFPGFHDVTLDYQLKADLQSHLIGKDAIRATHSDGVSQIYSYPLLEASWPNFSIEEAKCQEHPISQRVVLIGFSAGNIKAAIAAHRAILHGHSITALIAFDGWGVPFCDGRFPVYRFSHDLFTHNTSTLLGGAGLFFADPPVDHLSLWARPSQTKGWYLKTPNCAEEMSAMEGLVRLIQSLNE